MSADPKPHHCVISVHAEGSVMKPDANGVKATHSLEMERGMPRIPLEQFKLTIRKLAYRKG